MSDLKEEFCDELNDVIIELKAIQKTLDEIFRFVHPLTLELHPIYFTRKEKRNASK